MLSRSMKSCFLSPRTHMNKRDESPLGTVVIWRQNTITNDPTSILNVALLSLMLKAAHMSFVDEKLKQLLRVLLLLLSGRFLSRYAGVPSHKCTAYGPKSKFSASRRRSSACGRHVYMPAATKLPQKHPRSSCRVWLQIILTVRKLTELPGCSSSPKDSGSPV